MRRAWLLAAAIGLSICACSPGGGESSPVDGSIGPLPVQPSTATTAPNDSSTTPTTPETDYAGADADSLPALGFIDPGRIAVKDSSHGDIVSWDMLTLYNRSAVQREGPMDIEITDVRMERPARGEATVVGWYWFYSGRHSAMESNGSTAPLPDWVVPLVLPLTLSPVDPNGPSQEGNVDDDQAAVHLVWQVQFDGGDIVDLGGIEVSWRPAGTLATPIVTRVSASAGFLCVYHQWAECA